ncbi:TetR/AcrR family transcriptional regulator [Rhizobium sp. MHM7A]|uniref:TetR/AcrR family transcriptional regulator n=1 Tax=Rhizobium sp. MHM7A TaxID=2583233 RepID=UPI0011060EFC|nr:TetR/AcrR family transcriptional regulator [Rhizobium sp. MHM7A]TLX17113.1 TetR/AcrR family transcriptional regulator [Rhizobium sp. MHM7A]
MRISNEEKEQIVARIIDSAERQIAATGLSGLNLRSLASDAGIKPASLYNHFKGGLDEVILRVNSRTIKMLDQSLARAAKKADGEPVAVLFDSMAVAYLHFAIKHEKRFAALFEHRMANDAPIPEWHLQEHYNLFRHVERPLAAMNPNLGEDERRILARTIYSSVHGIVHLGRQGRLIALPVPVIEQQLGVITQVLADGLSAFAAKLS